MKLTPQRPPGRPNRKALAFEGEIARLRSEGYPCEAIWEALVEAGLTLSRSSVKREVARLAKRRLAEPKTALPIPTKQGRPSGVQNPVPAAATTRHLLPGQETAAAWFKGRNTNPLLRSRIALEDSRH